MKLYDLRNIMEYITQVELIVSIYRVNLKTRLEKFVKRSRL